MKINRNNYETYFIDYIENNLDEKLVYDFIEFLQQNPDLKEELSLFEPISLTPENIIFNKKEMLYKELFDNENEFNRANVAKLEGDLTEPEKSAFEAYLVKHPEKQREAELFDKTKLVPDESIIFIKKDKLYRKPAGKTVLLWTVRIAAVLILSIVIYNLTDQFVSPFSKEDKTAQTVNEIQENDINTEPVEPIDENGIKNETNLILAEVAASVTGNNNINAVKAVETENQPAERIPIEIPATIEPLSVSFKAKDRRVSLISVEYKEIITEIPENNERLIVDVFMEKTGINNLNSEKIKKVGLTLVAGLTRDKFSYQTDEGGRISKISYDSRLLAFSIPVNSKK